MAEEQVQAPEPAAAAPAPEVHTPSPVEQQALAQGWVPEDEWTGDPAQWRPAKEYVDRGELYKKIDDVKRENRKLREAFDALGQHHAKVNKLAYERALADLKEKKKEALAEGDVNAVVEIDDQIAEHRAAVQQPAQVAQPTGPHPDYTAWIAKNTWYTADQDMKQFADTVASNYAIQNNERDPSAILAEVDRRVRKAFPQKFVNPNRDKPGSVEGSTNKGASKKDTIELSDREKQIMERIVKYTPGMTKEKYLEEYKAVRGR